MAGQKTGKTRKYSSTLSNDELSRLGDLYEQIIDTVLEQGHTLSEISIDSHIAKSLLSSLHSGNKYIVDCNIKTLIQLRNYLHVNTEYLLGFSAAPMIHIDETAVSAATGLSLEAYTQIHEISELYKQQGQDINKIFESKYFSQMMFKALEFIKSNSDAERKVNEYKKRFRKNRGHDGFAVLTSKQIPSGTPSQAELKKSLKEVSEKKSRILFDSEKSWEKIMNEVCKEIDESLVQELEQYHIHEKHKILNEYIKSIPKESSYIEKLFMPYPMVDVDNCTTINTSFGQEMHEFIRTAVDDLPFEIFQDESFVSIKQNLFSRYLDVSGLFSSYPSQSEWEAVMKAINNMMNITLYAKFLAFHEQLPKDQETKEFMDKLNKYPFDNSTMEEIQTKTSEYESMVEGMQPSSDTEFSDQFI